MKAKIVKILRKPSRYGGFFFYVFFIDEKSNSFYSCIYPKMRNYKRWKPLLKKGIVLGNLELVRGKNNLINADSKVLEVK